MINSCIEFAQNPTAAQTAARFGETQSHFFYSWIGEKAGIQLREYDLGTPLAPFARDRSQSTITIRPRTADRGCVSLVCKITPSQSRFKFCLQTLSNIDNVNRDQTEYLFYDKFYPQLVNAGISMPHVIANEVVESPVRCPRFLSNSKDKYCLTLMEELSAKDFIRKPLFAHFSGPQIASVAKYLADIHAHFAGSTISDVAPNSSLCLSSPTRARIADALFPPLLRRFLINRSRTKAGKAIANDPAQMQMLKALGNHFPLRKIAASPSLFRFRTVIHGDCHGGNLFLDRKARKVILIDWQRFGWDSPANELAYLFAHCSNFHPSRDRIVLVDYHDHLVSGGVNPREYSLADLESEFKVATMTLTKLFVMSLSGRRLAPYKRPIFHRVLPRLIARSTHYYRSGIIDSLQLQNRGTV